jgi:DNA-binding transcriptional LysR family regulator
MNTILDIELLRTFHTVFRVGKFRVAAEHLHKSPAAISVHIQRLEAVAGGRLLERDNQSVSLTPLGQRLLTATVDLLNAHDRVLGELRGPHLAGRIRLGIPDDYAAHVIGDILPTFTVSWPNVVLEVTTAPSFTLRDQLERGRLDLAVLAQPQVKPHPQIQVLTATTPVWVGGFGLPAPSKDEPVPLALYAADCPYRVAMKSTLTEAGRAWKIVLDSASSQVVRTCVEAGLAVTLVDRARVTEKMRILNDLPIIPDHEVVLMRSSPVKTDEAVDILANAIQQYFRL